MCREGVDQVRNRPRHPGAHEHDIDACEHGAVEGPRGGELDLFQAVDANEPVMPFLREPGLDEAAEDEQFLRRAVGREGHLEYRRVRLPRGAATLEEVAGERPIRHVLIGEVMKSATDVATLIAVLEAASEYEIEGRS